MLSFWAVTGYQPQWQLPVKKQELCWSRKRSRCLRLTLWHFRPEDSMLWAPIRAVNS